MAGLVFLLGFWVLAGAWAFFSIYIAQFIIIKSAQAVQNFQAPAITEKIGTSLMAVGLSAPRYLDMTQAFSYNDSFQLVDYKNKRRRIISAYQNPTVAASFSLF